MHVTELARMAGVTPDVVRYYTQIGLLKPKREGPGNYRVFARNDLLRLNFIRRAQTLGYTLGEIRQILAASEKRRSPCPMVRKIIAERISANRRHMRESMALQRRMEAAAKQWLAMTDAVPIGDSICHLIEQVTADDPATSPRQRRK